MSRKNAREAGFQLTYERCIANEDNDMTLSMFLNASVNEDDKNFIEKIYRGISDNIDVIKRAISEYAKDFSFERIYKVDLSILYVAVYEILFCDDIPVEVSVNEAVELSKTYSTDKSASYINGVLASVIRNKENILNESDDN